MYAQKYAFFVRQFWIENLILSESFKLSAPPMRAALMVSLALCVQVGVARTMLWVLVAVVGLAKSARLLVARCGVARRQQQETGGPQWKG